MKADESVKKGHPLRSERQTVLDDLCVEVHSHTDEERLSAFVLDGLRQLAGGAFKAALFVKLDHARRTLSPLTPGKHVRRGKGRGAAAWLEAVSSDPSGVDSAVPWDSRGLREAMRAGEFTVLGKDTHPWVPRAWWRLLGADNSYFRPLGSEDFTWGALLVSFAGGEDVDGLEGVDLFLSHVSSAFGNLGFRAMMKSRLEEIGTIIQVGKSIGSASDVEGVLELASRLSAQVLGAEGSLLWLTTEQSELRLAASFGAGTEMARRGLKAALAEAAEWVCREGEPLIVSRTSEDERFVKLEPEVMSLVAAPLPGRGKSLGAIALLNKVKYSDQDRGFFQEDERELVKALAEAISLAVSAARVSAFAEQLKSRLRDAEMRLQRSEKLAALGEMSAKAAHETRNVLASIGGFAGRISKALPDGDSKREWADIISREVKRLERILTEQLEFARLGEPRFAFVSLNTIVEESLRLFEEQLDRRKVKLVRNLARNVPRLVLDAERIKQVVLNILRNAHEALEGKGGTISVKSRVHSASVEVEIGNSGSPIPGELLDQLFVPFASTKTGGSGLGLAIAHQIIKEHGGEIKVRSESGEGTYFSIIIPLRENEDRRMRVGDRRRRATDRRRKQ